MFGRPLALTGAGPALSRVACRSASSSSGGGAPAKARTGNVMLQAALTSGTFSILGDLLAQLLPQRHKLRKGGSRLDWDYVRTLRMGGFGFVFYGPYQSKWYAALDSRFPSNGGWSNFLTKVVLNQIALSPVVLAVVFSWNLCLTGQARKIPDKIRHDLVPTMVNGWKFWVPASSINFALVPLRYQVLYMSVCSVLWTAYLSHASNG